MAQDEQKVLPEFLNLDTVYEKMEPNESPFIKGMSNSINGNPDTGNGQSNPVGEGQNVSALTPTRSNAVVPDALVQAGYNLTVGKYESIITNELYYFTYNSEGNHNICVLNGDSNIWSLVLVDVNLGFTDDPSNYIADHRVTLKVIYGADATISEKILMFTFGYGWQKWILVNTAISTNGFDANRFPYFTLQQPHFDRRELLEWATRQPMLNPTVTAIPNTPDDANKINRSVDQAFQFAIGYNMTDGRQTPLSPYSLAYFVKSEDFLNNPDSLPKNALITLYAGSCLVESIDIYVRQTSPPSGTIAEQVSWGDWHKYIRIYKYGNQGSVLGTPYWTRTNPFSNNNYDPVQNTIEYVFDNSLLSEIVDNDNFTTRLQNDIPQISKALTEVGDANLLGNNRYGYNNLSAETVNNFSAEVGYKTTNSCLLPLRKIDLYAYVGYANDNNVYYSQVGYYNGQDTTIRFGSLTPGGGGQTTANFSETLSKLFGLDFADKKGFRCYLKGTPFYTDGIWVQINSDFSQVELTEPLDFSNLDTLAYVNTVFNSGGFFVCKFKFLVPAGRYIATLGRHNVPSDGDYRNTSTYIMGIANSRLASLAFPADPATAYITVTPSDIITQDKELEIDCTDADIDVWGNGQDLFYVYCPYQPAQGNTNHRFIEGYLQESRDNSIGVELFPYELNIGANATGTFTDKNGFYFAYVKRSNAATANIEIKAKLNCSPIGGFFEIPTSSGGQGWKPNGTSYVSDHNSGTFGDCNKIIVTGKILSLDGSVGYSNISVSIKEGATATTDSNGKFNLVVHNGLAFNRVENIYINAGGNFLITIEECGDIPLINYNEALSPCINCKVRNYPTIITLKLNAQGDTDTSLKENATYSVGLACADLAGRLGYINVVSSQPIPSFLTRNNVLPSFFKLLLAGASNFPTDMAWVASYVSNQLNVLNYTQWIADSLSYVDANGNVVDDATSAAFISINITSLYNTNVAKNFSLLSTYQFVNGDRIRVLDNGQGQLLDTATYGEEINLQILGSNYNQAAMAAGIIANDSPVPVINNNLTNNVTANVTAASGNATITTLQTEQNNISVTLYVKYDSRFNAIIKNTGIWIELYTPAQTVQVLPYNELQWYPIIDGEIAEFVEVSGGVPQYEFPTEIDIPFWDTYLFSRDINIPNVGNQFLAHPFESPNISDAFGYKITSGGRMWVKNDNAKQLWYISDVIKSDNYGGIVNGLGTFQAGILVNNRQDFSQNNWGGIEAMITQRNTILFVCEKDFFLTNFNYHYAYLDQQGRMIANLADGISTPAQKIGSNYGMDDKSHATLVVHDVFVTWYDINNEAWVICDYSSATDISDIKGEDGKKYGIKSYMTKKTQFISNWNAKQPDNSTIIDVVSGIDVVRKNLIISFRPRRNNSNNPLSYINNRRNIDLKTQETIVYNLDTRRWTKFEGYVAESYGNLKGGESGVEFISFAAGKPYIHNQSGNTSYLNFFGVQTEPVIMSVFNKDADILKIFQSISYDSVSMRFFADLVYDNNKDSFSYIPYNFFKTKSKFYYAAFLREMSTYMQPVTVTPFRSTLIDGKRVYGRYVIVRLVGHIDSLNKYFQLNSINCLFTSDVPTKA